MSKSRLTTYIILAFLIILPYAGMLGLFSWYRIQVKSINNASFIVISKEDMNLRLVDYRGREIVKYPIACGINYGNKEKVGDLKTPEGLFHITEIENAKNWKHDFNDGLGEIDGAYGPYFLRLEVPGHKGIGIHGTHKPESIGTRDTEGCIRLNNSDLENLVKKVHVGTAVFITPSYMDVIKSGKVDSLKLAIKEHEDEYSMRKGKAAKEQKTSQSRKNEKVQTKETKLNTK